VNPTYAKGVHVVARIADELGKFRPDIPLLVVESRGTEETLASCGLDLHRHGTISLMGNTRDAKDFWGVTRLCLMPSLWLESEGLVAVEAMMNGIPVIASDRGALPSTLGDAGFTLPLPDRLTPATRSLPTSDEIRPWLDAILRVWDDADLYKSQANLARLEAMRWDPERIKESNREFFANIGPRANPRPGKINQRPELAVLVPHLNGIDQDCEQSLLELERLGIQVIRRSGSSQIDVARSEMASSALRAGFQSILFVDSDIGFEAIDAVRLLIRPERVIAGIYAKKNHRELSSRFSPDTEEVHFGSIAIGFYPLEYAATGFLKISTGCLSEMIEKLELPLCNTQWGEGFWPFFQPVVIPSDWGFHYLGEDWAFSHRLAAIGVTPLADTSIRLWHYGRFAFGWEDAGQDRVRYAGFKYKV